MNAAGVRMAMATAMVLLPYRGLSIAPRRRVRFSLAHRKQNTIDEIVSDKCNSDPVVKLAKVARMSCLNTISA